MVNVRVPASTSNLGSGFDSFGMALQIYLDVVMSIEPSGLIITAAGEGRAEISTNSDNLIFLSAKKVFEHIRKPAPTLRIKIENGIPLYRGLGSSGAAIVAGLICGNILSVANLSDDEIISLAMAFEGHPENVATSLLGGATINCSEGGRVITKKIEIDDNLRAVIWVPTTLVATKVARNVLPKTVPHDDAVFNLQRSALLAHALIARNYDSLKIATADRLHQPYRKHLIEGFENFVSSGYAGGASGVCISGSGSAILAICTHGETHRVEAAWEALRKSLNLSGRVLVCRFENRGAQILA
jgi:homoserine kinase